MANQIFGVNKFMNSDQIRETFLSYFESENHLRMPSASLVPVGDPTLLLTNAGMVQFKPYFSGEATPPNRRLTTSQKSFRTVDIDEVGDDTHLTMFEMLGNFSIGDYFKEGAIEFSLKCLTSAFGISQDKLYVTIHNTDEDTSAIWIKAGIPGNRIYKFGDEDNWWGPAGSEGPCGPCSELHYDFGDDRGCGDSECGPNCTRVINDSGDVCGRFVELWNLVFMQYYHHLDGSRTSLPAPSVDTGMGLERLAVVKQDVRTIYDTDLFKSLIQKVEQISGKTYESDSKTKYAMRVVVEHARSAVFLIADGVVPGNEGRGYVLRRVIRRSIRHSRSLEMKTNFLGEIADSVINEMGFAYPELHSHKEFILTVLKLEEDRFHHAFQNGYNILNDALQAQTMLSGEMVFQLWDTYGFPIEVTREIARENNIDVDIEGFENAMKAQRDKARASGRFDDDRVKIRLYESLGVGGTKFLGYEKLRESSIAVGLISNSQVVNQVNEGDEVEIVLLQTPFYPEGGGQVGDAGVIVGPSGKVDIIDTQTVMPNLIVHFGIVSQGSIVLGESVDATVDEVRREDTARNHTATHMLHAALRQILGQHVRQAGSLVAPDRLRFDFSHVEPVSEEEITHIEWLVNEKIRQNAVVHKSEDRYTSAIQRGAIAFFGDKYDDSVRLVEITNGSTFSFEVCGGTHVERTGEVGAVYVLSESSIGSGMRRIEAVSGRSAQEEVRKRFKIGDRLIGTLQTNLPDLEEKVQSLLNEMDDLRRRNEVLETKFALKSAESLLSNKSDINGVTVLVEEIEVSKADTLREMGDWFRDKIGSGIIVLGSVIGDQPVVNVNVTSDLIDAGFDARDLARYIGKAIGGGGGGRPESAQAGGKQADQLQKALSLADEFVRNH